jgi:hypothetical protein
MYDKAWLISQLHSRDFTSYKMFEFPSIRRLVHSWYDGAAFSGRIQKLETQTEEVKQSYWDEAKKSSLPIEEKIKTAKCIYYLSCVYEN